MGAGAVFVLIVAAIIVIGAIVAIWGVRAGLWAKETSPKGDDTESRFQRGDDRPEHTEVDEAGGQRYVGS